MKTVFHLLYIFILLNLVCVCVIARPAAAQDMPAAQSAAESPLTVLDLIVDKTAENAVVAREQAIVEARRLAFQKLAERNLTPEDFKAFKLPSDNDIAILVQDFEIKNEQLSATRYVASFTVRFRDEVQDYLQVEISADEEKTVAGTTAVESPDSVPSITAAPRSILILPYYENIFGRTYLWEDPNPWREVWQASPPSIKGWNIVVPLGDIGDIMQGDGNAVWSGDNSVVEKLRRHYDTDEVILAVANKSSSSMVIDVYTYQNGELARQKSLTPHIGELPENAAFGEGLRAVMAFLQTAPAALQEQFSVEENISRQLTGQLTGRAVPVPVSGKTAAQIDATMTFTDFSAWLDLQKRLSGMKPAVAIEITNISMDGASFTMSWPGGDVRQLQSALQERGIAISQRLVEVGEFTPGGAQISQNPVYDLQLLN